MREKKPNRVVSMPTADVQALNDLSKRLREPREFLFAACVRAFAKLPTLEQLELVSKIRLERIQETTNEEK